MMFWLSSEYGRDAFWTLSQYTRGLSICMNHMNESSQNYLYFVASELQVYSETR